MIGDPAMEEQGVGPAAVRDPAMEERPKPPLGRSSCDIIVILIIILCGEM